MAPVRCLILCKSVHHGSTAKVAEAIGAVLHADVVSPEGHRSGGLDRNMAVGIGSGIYYGRMHEALFDWLRGLPDAPDTATPSFLFSTAGLPWLSWLWHWPMRRLLARKGFRVLGEFSCAGHDTWGPLRLGGGLNKKHPDDGDVARAERFAEGIARKLGSVG